jgi:endoglucanase Acf2
MTNFGRLMLAMEVRAAHQYWYISSQSNVYAPPFSDNKLAGILWSTKASA